MKGLSDSGIVPEVSRFKVCYWNGGGGLLKRLKVNPALRKLLDKRPDIFVYGESGMSTKRGLFLKDYIFIFHRSYIKAADKYRRGLVIFYLKKYQHFISKVYSSKIFDIVWIRVKFECEAVYFCFFYAPGSHLPEDVRLKFYHIFTAQYDKFSQKSKVFLMGDSNTRLGKVLNDMDIHGNHVSNKNKPLFLGFLDYSGLTLLNRKYSFGIPTYEVMNRKRSIIDFGMTNSDHLVENFEIIPTNFGVSPQTCHKVLELSIKLGYKEPVKICADRVNFNTMGSKEFYYFSDIYWPDLKSWNIPTY